MSRFRGKAHLPDGVSVPKERQLSFLERLDSLTQRVETLDPTKPAMALYEKYRPTYRDKQVVVRVKI